ncbi:MAG: hypothetical protein AAGE43_15615 [Pseudomonadota bacterium]
MVRYPVLVLAGLLSAPLMEVLSMLWLNLVPAEADLTASYFPMVVLPVAIVVHFLAALVCWKAFEPAPKAGGVVYLAAHLAAQGAMLATFNNPAGDIAAFLGILLASGSVILFVFDRYFWCPQCAGPI